MVGYAGWTMAGSDRLPWCLFPCRAVCLRARSEPRVATLRRTMKRGAFFGGLFLLTLCTLMLEVLETRLLSVVTWYHLAFFVISAAMFGMTAGAIWVYRHAERHTPDTLAGD